MTSAPIEDWASLACSADGVKLVAGIFGYPSQNTNQFYISTNAGATWTSSNIPGAPPNLIAIASSANGKRLVVLAAFPLYPSTPQMYVSVDGGATWAETGPQGINWTSLAMSADGYEIAASAGPTPLTFVGNGIYLSKSVPEPALSSISESTNLLLSWTIPSASFILQENPDLRSTNWTDVPVRSTFELTNLAQQVRVTPAQGSSFFRLKSYSP